MYNLLIKKYKDCIEKIPNEEYTKKSISKCIGVNFKQVFDSSTYIKLQAKEMFM